MLWILCFAFFEFSTATSQINSAFQVMRAPTSNATDVSICTRKIIEDFVVDNHFIIDVVLININDAIQIHKLHGIKKARFMIRPFSWTKSNFFNRIYVVSASDFKELESGMKQAMDDYYFNPRSNFIFILDRFKGYEQKMVNFLVFYNIYNVTILANDKKHDDYKIYAFQSPIHPCDQNEKIVEVFRCSGYKLGSYDIPFPKIKNINGCSFKLMTYNLFPLINLDNPKEEGVQQRVLRHFEKYAGINIHLIPYSRTDKFGKFFANFTYVDILEKVDKNLVDGAVGGYFISSIDIRKYSFSYPLSIDHLMVILPRADFEDSWRVFYNRRNLSVVIMVATLFLIFTMASHILSLFPAHRNNFMRNTLIVYGYFLNKVTIYKFKPGVPESLVIGSFLFAIFIIPYTMQSFMLSIKTHPLRGWEPKSFDEVFGKRTLVLTSVWKKEGLCKDRQECETTRDCMQQVRDAKDKSKYTFITDETYETYKWKLADARCKLGLYKLQEPVSTMMRCIIFRRGSVLERPFNKLVSKLTAAGLIGQHFREITYKEFLKCKPQYNPAVGPLKMFHFMGAYEILLAGYFVSAISFVFEVLTYRI